VREAMEPKGANLMDIVRAIAGAIGDSIARTFKPPAPIDAKDVGGWYVAPVHDLPLADEGTAWSWDTAASNAVLGDDDWARFARAHLLVDRGGESGWPENKGAYKLPVAKMMDGSLKYVWRGAAAANAALSGARSELRAPGEAKSAAATTLKGIYKKFDKDPDSVGAQTVEPRTLMAFTSKLQDGSEAEPDEDDGLLWKEVIHPGQWHKMDSGRIVQVTKEIIQSAYEAFKAGLPKRVSVPAGSYHPESVAAEDNRGFVRKLKMVGDRLFGGFEFTNPDTRAAVEEGSIADCSVYLEPEVVHPQTGDKFEWALTHVLLTNNPLVQDLAPFGAPIPASASGNVTVDVYVQDKDDEEVEDMGEEQNDITLSAEDQALIDGAKELGLTAEDIKAMVAERERVKKQARDLYVTKVVRALEGKDEHELVTQVENTRHWPVVIAAAEKAMREQAKALSADGGADVDAIVLSVVNAIPAEGRMQVAEQPTGAKTHVDPTLAEDEDKTPTDEQIKAFAEGLTPRKGSAVQMR